MWKSIDFKEQILERLSFDTSAEYSGIEAAIHVTRYALARNLCNGKKVLDIACGEGYGSRLLLEWGASEVVAVDASHSAIDSACKNFSKPGIRYLRGDAMEVDQLVAGEKFDLIISIETIEHLVRPNDFLSAIGGLRKENACVLITCPNDWWYYPKEDEGNIYHMRKYTCDEFIDLVTAGLGAPDAVGVGAPTLGFVNLPINHVGSRSEKVSQIEMLKCCDHGGTLVLPPEPGSISIKNASYFLAAWGIESKDLIGAAILPMSMDFFSAGFWQSKVNSQNGIDGKELQLRLRSTEAKVDAAVAEVARLSDLCSTTANNENEMEALSDQLEEQRLLTQKFRIQTNALLQETDLMQQALADKNRILTPEAGLLQHALAEKDRIIGEQEIYLRALLKRWNLVTAVPRKVLPTSLIAGIKQIVRFFKTTV